VLVSRVQAHLIEIAGFGVCRTKKGADSGALGTFEDVLVKLLCGALRLFGGDCEGSGAFWGVRSLGLGDAIWDDKCECQGHFGGVREVVCEIALWSREVVWRWL
jgi:hypothetical protein